MTWHTPSFWYRPPGMASTSLIPLSGLYHLLHIADRSIKGKNPYTSKLPVICIGNLTAGGSGKTPVVESLYRLIQAQGIAQRPVILTRGYGHDEAQMLRQKGCAVIISSDRVKGAQLCEGAGYDLILLDDGFQNRSIKKNLSFIVIDGLRGFGNEHLIPAGPLREPIESGVARADAAMIIGTDVSEAGSRLPPSFPVFSGTTETDFKAANDQNYVAFCGIAHPDKFRRTLTDLGVEPKVFKIYPDHHAYKPEDIEKLKKIASEHKARLLTTEKDAIKMQESQLSDIMDIVPITIQWQNVDSVIKFIKERLAHA